MTRALQIALVMLSWMITLSWFSSHTTPSITEACETVPTAKGCPVMSDFKGNAL